MSSSCKTCNLSSLYPLHLSAHQLLCRFGCDECAVHHHPPLDPRHAGSVGDAGEQGVICMHMFFWHSWHSTNLPTIERWQNLKPKPPLGRPSDYPQGTTPSTKCVCQERSVKHLMISISIGYGELLQSCSCAGSRMSPTEYCCEAVPASLTADKAAMRLGPLMTRV